MKTENKIYNFFIIISLLFWNPVSFYVLYKSTPVITIKLMWIIYIIFLVGGIISIRLISKNKLGRKLKDIILSIAFIGIIGGTIICVNSSIENDVTSAKLEEGLIFPKNKNVKSQTIEYDYDIITNSLGLRDREISIEKGDKYRILCFGDSWTMGFGVNIEHSWPRKLQDYLIDKQFDNIEVINCGKGGQYTTKYLEYMNKTVPLLKPDLVLVGVLQLDDLAQLYEHNNISDAKIYTQNISLKAKLKYVIKTYGKHSVGNILKRRKQSINLKQNNINSVNNRITKYDYLQKKQYEVLPDSVKYLFETGNLNPGLLNSYVSFTYRVAVFNDPKHSATKFAIEKMNEDIREMKLLCEQHNTKMIFINMPTARFTGHKVIRTPNDIFNNFLKENNHIDIIYKNVAEKNDLPYLELTNHFIELEDKTKYFFRFDGHL